MTNENTGRSSNTADGHKTCDEMLTVKDVSRRLGVSRGLVYREIRLGHLKCHRFGKRTLRVSTSNLKRYIEHSAEERLDSCGAGADQFHNKPGAIQTTFHHIDVSRLPSSRN